MSVYNNALTSMHDPDFLPPLFVLSLSHFPSQLEVSFPYIILDNFSCIYISTVELELELSVCVLYMIKQQTSSMSQITKYEF